MLRRSSEKYLTSEKENESLMTFQDKTAHAMHDMQINLKINEIAHSDTIAHYYLNMGTMSILIAPNAKYINCNIDFMLVIQL